MLHLFRVHNFVYGMTSDSVQNLKSVFSDNLLIYVFMLRAFTLHTSLPNTAKVHAIHVIIIVITHPKKSTTMCHWGMCTASSSVCRVWIWHFIVSFHRIAYYSKKEMMFCKPLSYRVEFFVYPIQWDILCIWIYFYNIPCMKSYSPLPLGASNFKK